MNPEAGLPFIPPQASTLAEQTDTLFLFMIVSTGLIALVIFACLIFFVAKYRRRPGNEVAVQIKGSTTLELAWTMIPLGLAMIPFAWGASVYLELGTPPSDTLNVYVVTRQWMWKFQQPDGQSEINELHIPVGRPVRLTMVSQDVIHSFYVPAFRIKQDVLPGRYTTAWFQATKVGTYHLFCAEYCGTDHSQMVGWVTVMDPADYETWLAQKAPESPAVGGEKLFQQLGCNACHRADSLRRAPVLDGLYGQPVILSTGEQVIADDNYLRESILNPAAKVVAGYQPIMPSFQGQISEEQLIILLAYLRSIGPGPGSPSPEPRPLPPFPDAASERPAPPSPIPPPPRNITSPPGTTTTSPANVTASPASTTPSPTGAAPSAAEGERLFHQLGCSACHLSNGQGAAPALEGVYGQPVTLSTGQQVTADDNYLRESILNPTAKVVAGYQPIMPSFQGQITDAQLASLLAYIQSIGSATGSPSPVSHALPANATPSPGTATSSAPSSSEASRP